LTRQSRIKGSSFFRDSDLSTFLFGDLRGTEQSYRPGRTCGANATLLNVSGGTPLVLLSSVRSLRRTSSWSGRCCRSRGAVQRGLKNVGRHRSSYQKDDEGARQEHRQNDDRLEAASEETENWSTVHSVPPDCVGSGPKLVPLYCHRITASGGWWSRNVVNPDTQNTAPLAYCAAESIVRNNGPERHLRSLQGHRALELLWRRQTVQRRRALDAIGSLMLAVTPAFLGGGQSSGVHASM
jgi:hypothetical protein